MSKASRLWHFSEDGEIVILIPCAPHGIFFWELRGEKGKASGRSPVPFRVELTDTEEVQKNLHQNS